MIQFKAFKAVLPNPDCFSEVPVLNPHLFALENSSEKSFFKVMEQDAFGAKKTYQNFLNKGILQPENEAGFYIYQQESKSHQYTGIIGLCSIQDFKNGKILPHEKTISKREKQFLRYLKHNPIQAEPVCLISESDVLSKAIHQYCQAKPLASFIKNNLIHRFWKINPQEKITNIFNQTEHLYIADGHHRLSSVARYQKINAEAKALLSFVIPKNNIGIFPYHREIILSELEQKLVHQYLLENQYEHLNQIPDCVQENCVLLGLNGILYQKKFAKGSFVLNEINESLFNNTLAEITSSNLKFIPGEKTISELWMSKTSNLLQVFLPKVSFEQIKSFSQNHQFFPPKSTWILPKIPTGLCIYKM